MGANASKGENPTTGAKPDTTTAAKPEAAMKPLIDNKLAAAQNAPAKPADQAQKA